MTPWATDIGNAYLEAKTTEKVCIKAGPEFGELQGNLLIIDKALYGLRLSGKAFNQLLSVHNSPCVDGPRPCASITQLACSGWICKCGK
jgi:hypothetical protein